MSENFDELLSGVVDSAGGAARKPGAEAARKRGRQRRSRQRLAASALTVVVLGGAGSVAAFSLQHNGSVGKVPAANSSGSALATVTATGPSPSPSDSASTAPTAPTASPTADVATASTTTTTTSTPTASSPSTSQTLWSAVPGSWLSPSQVPLNSTLHWTGGAASSAQSGVALLPATPNLYPCVNTDFYNASSDVKGFATNTFTATSDVSSAAFNGTPGAVQSYVVYDTAAQAKAAYQVVEHDVASCASTLQDAVTKLPGTQSATTTASVDGGFAYRMVLRDDNGTPAQAEGNYGEYSDYHAYIVLRGNLIDIVYLQGGPVVDDSSHDGAGLATMIGALG